MIHYIKIKEREWKPESKILDYVERCNHKILKIDTDRETPQWFYSYSLLLDNGLLEIIIFSHYQRIKPEIYISEKEERAIIGTDFKILWIDLRTATIEHSMQLYGVFYEMIPLTHDEVIVIYEIGVMKINLDGKEIWNTIIDVIEDFTIESNKYIVIKAMDSLKKIIVSIETGDKLQRLP